jgi:hypothetical protein
VAHLHGSEGKQSCDKKNGFRIDAEEEKERREDDKKDQCPLTSCFLTPLGEQIM